jgi:hypothetical protein
MGTAYPTHNKQGRRDKPRVRGDEYTDETLSLPAEDNKLRAGEPALRGDEYADDILLSLLEENARLRGLVVKLSNLILRNVAEQR